MKKIIGLALVVMILNGCCLLGFNQTYKEYNNQVTCTNYTCGFGEDTCTVYDPILKQQVLISETTGIVSTCSTQTHPCIVYLFEHAQCYTCQSTYADSMGNSWNGASYNEEATNDATTRN